MTQETQTTKPRIVGTIKAVPSGTEILPNGDWKNYVLCVRSIDEGEEKATPLTVPSGQICKADAERFAEMLNEWAGK